MYDDTTDPPFGQRLSPGAYVHLCPDCRELMAAVLRATTSTIPEPTPPPDWEQALRWLDAQCGGREAVLRLGDGPLTGPPPAVPEHASAEQTELVAQVGELVDAVARHHFDAEFALACRRAMALILAQRPGVALDQRAAAMAHGVVWAVARANGLLYPSGVVSDRTLRDFFGSRQAGSVPGRKAQVALRSLFTWSDPGAASWRWPVERTPLDPLGHPALLVSGVRRRLIEVRERALREAATDAADRE